MKMRLRRPHCLWCGQPFDEDHPIIAFASCPICEDCAGLIVMPEHTVIHIVREPKPKPEEVRL